MWHVSHAAGRREWRTVGNGLDLSAAGAPARRPPSRLSHDVRTALVTTPAQVRPRRRRKPPRPVEVVSVGKITPRLISVELGGDALSGFQLEAPTQHIKVFLPVEGQDAPTIPVATEDGLAYPDDAPRPIVRTYTPRRFNSETGTLEVQFVLHGDGPASDWAQKAKPATRSRSAGLAAGSSWTSTRTAGGSLATRVRSRRSRRCSRHSRRRPSPTCTWRSAKRPTRLT